ncbi:histidine kinase N-terminal 7TM domain-containing protein [Herbivorax sp. ANBcel31]|uniref:sensor histidine kinase n=1 Tax=Herbivorax sp. ANBcel31 TaxID=3069754 RepID=UPI0027B50372|nr:histidine kinase N-terminal 7TM domain-containing protein [Herbivorax sp. ANBcel31]MDQ2087629.1 histidine kinase N-terminal 7TM domain-containing protein [Herbivorax sp. ANBcel31]
MNFNFIILVLHILSLTICLGSTFYLITHARKTILIYCFLWLQGIILVWTSGQLFEIYTLSITAKWALNAFQYIGISLIGLCWLTFSLVYSDYSFNKKSKFLYKILFIFPVIFYFLLLTNNYHHLFYKEFHMDYKVYGLFFWFNLIFNQLLVTIGTLVIIKYSLKTFRQSKKELSFIVFATMIPQTANIFTVFLNINIDLTPLAFSLCLLLFIFATYKYNFINIVPEAFRSIVKNMSESIVVLDSLNRIVIYNDSFEKNFKNIFNLKSSTQISAFIEGLKIYADNDSESFTNALMNKKTFSFNGKIKISHSTTKYFLVNINPVKDIGKHIVGRVISFTDVTYDTILLEEISIKNKELLNLNLQLEAFAHTTEELAIANERNRFAKDMHDSLGHSFSALLTLMKVSKIMYKKDFDEGESNLDEAIKVASEGVKELRRSIKGLMPSKFENDNLTSSLKSLTLSFNTPNLNINFVSKGTEPKINSLVSIALFRCCQESLTNALKHSNADFINVTLIFNVNNIILKVKDNGSGCEKINKGFGLIAIEQRINELKGNLIIKSSKNKGFLILIKIPV